MSEMNVKMHQLGIHPLQSKIIMYYGVCCIKQYNKLVNTDFYSVKHHNYQTSIHIVKCNLMLMVLNVDSVFVYTGSMVLIMFTTVVMKSSYGKERMSNVDDDFWAKHE